MLIEDKKYFETIKGPANGPEDKHPRPIIAACFALGKPLPTYARYKHSPAYYLGDFMSEEDDLLDAIICRVGQDKIKNYAREKLEVQFEKFENRFHNNDVVEKNKTNLAVYFTDWMLYSRPQGWDFEDYFEYEGYNKEIPVRNGFLCRADVLGFSKLFNTQIEDRELLKYKSVFNDTFKDFIIRDWLEIDAESFEAFESFVKKHSSFISKPNTGQQGNGIKIINTEDLDIRALHESLKGEGLIIEELVVQHEELAKVNASTLNTIRVETFRCADGSIKPIAANIRFGREGSIVDNFHSNGIGGQLDIESGKICSLMIDQKHNLMSKHPDSGITLLGLACPMWDKVIDVACRAAEIMPKCRNIGWDLAVRSDGQVEIIEGNAKPGFGIMQATDQRGKYSWFEGEVNAIEEPEYAKMKERIIKRHSRKDISIKGKQITRKRVIFNRLLGR